MNFRRTRCAASSPAWHISSASCLPRRALISRRSWGNGSARNCIWRSESGKRSFTFRDTKAQRVTLVSALGLNRVKSNREFLIRGNYERHIENSSFNIRDRYGSRKSAPAGNFIHDGNDGGGLGASDFLFI